MFALVESGSVTKFFKGNKGVSIGDTQYPKQIFQSWSNSELQAIGIYPVRIDTTNKKDEAWYINTNITYAVSGDEVVGSYGTATAKEIEDRNATDEDGVELDPVVVIKGLKTIKKEMINNQCAGILQPSDWRVIKAKETSTTMDSGWKTWRASVRTKCNSMQTQIDGATNVEELKALFEYTNTGTEANPVYTRPLGEFPVK
ncbi:N-acetylmuramidase/lysin [uncultured Mediterranean phage uvMED]|nr:N-acetylmuramidase/lysin [uncultured Mediterranean phage uvMED]